MPSTYSSRSGAAVRNDDGTCSNVSCHGGKATPVWLTGAIDVNIQCASCHSFNNGEYTSYYSGQHEQQVTELQFPCYPCHDTARLAAVHFTSLNTRTVMEGPAAAILNSSLSYTNGSCSPSCHGTEVW
jgi:predicted CxxxxCH...CXXCH cytochrome family protein